MGAAAVNNLARGRKVQGAAACSLAGGGEVWGSGGGSVGERPLEDFYMRGTSTMPPRLQQILYNNNNIKIPSMFNLSVLDPLQAGAEPIGLTLMHRNTGPIFFISTYHQKKVCASGWASCGASGWA
jgi:hypothetical protein